MLYCVVCSVPTTNTITLSLSIVKDWPVRGYCKYQDLMGVVDAKGVGKYIK